jgi:hypothetical protein
MRTRQIRIEGDVAYVPLTQGYEAVIDAVDVDLVADRNWCAYKNRNLVYAATNIRLDDGRKVLLKMHRLISCTPDGMHTDHADGNGLNNRRDNLRHATRSENLRNRGAQSNNTTGFKGVHRRKDCQRWQATIQINGKQKNIGLFATPEQAFAAYSEAAVCLHGEFARTA